MDLNTKYFLAGGVLVAAAIALASCDQVTSDARADAEYQGHANDHANDVHYAIDKRTGLCYGYSPGNTAYALTNVPCTKEVLKLTQKAAQ